MGAYHHGNLKNALIEAGIQLLNRGGEAQLSLRAVAAECGVSHAAPYNHFKDKAGLLQAIDDYVVDHFLEALQAAVTSCRYMHDMLFELGRAYVVFFADHPQYYTFLFLRQSKQRLQITAGADGVLESTFAPFTLFQQTAESVLEHLQLPRRELSERVLTMWITVQGMASIFTIEGFCYQGDREEFIRGVLRGRLHVK